MSLWRHAARGRHCTLPPHRGKATWRMARPDVYSVRHTTVEDYLQPMVHEVKVSLLD